MSIPVNAPGPINALPITDCVQDVAAIPGLWLWVTPDDKFTAPRTGIVETLAGRAGVSSGMVRISGMPVRETPAWSPYPCLHLQDRGGVSDGVDYFEAVERFDYVPADGLTVVSLFYLTSGPVWGFVDEAGASVAGIASQPNGYTFGFGAAGATADYSPALAEKAHLHISRYTGGNTVMYNVDDAASGARALATVLAPEGGEPC